MRLEYYPKKKLDKELRTIVQKHLNLDDYELFYFGSRVTGKGDDRSDIDVGIKGNTKIPITIVESIKNEIDQIPTLYTIDFVDFSDVSDEFKEVALEKIEKII